MPITNFETITEQLTDKEMILLPCVEAAFKKVDSKDKAIKSNDLCELINMIYVRDNGMDKFYIPMNGVRLRKFVNHFRVNGLMPIIATSEGYYLDSNKEEIEKQIKSLTERANGILAAAEGLQKFIDRKLIASEK